MPVVTMFNGKNKLNLGLKGALDYVMDKDATHGYVGTRGVLKNAAYDSMMLTKQLYRKTEGRQKIHFCVSFSKKECNSVEVAHEIGMRIMDIFSDKYQIVVGTHVNTDHCHCHFVINSVSYNTGKKLELSPKDLKELKGKIKDILNLYNLELNEVDDFQEVEDFVEWDSENFGAEEVQTGSVNKKQCTIQSSKVGHDKEITIENNSLIKPICIDCNAENEQLLEDEPSDSLLLDGLVSKNNDIDNHVSDENFKDMDYVYIFEVKTPLTSPDIGNVNTQKRIRPIYFDGEENPLEGSADGEENILEGSAKSESSGKPLIRPIYFEGEDASRRRPFYFVDGNEVNKNE